jgi:DNA-binding Xre family transcriptional regulator
MTAAAQATPLGIRLRRFRLADRRMTQATLAKRAGRSQTLIALLESGKRTGCRRSTLERLAAALGVSVARLTEESDDGAM